MSHSTQVPPRRTSPAVLQFRLPDPGEGLTEAEIVTWRVAPGDVVAVNDPLVEIETAKSLVELPSPFAGVVVELLVPEGATVAVGTPVITVDTGTGGDAMGDAGPVDAGTVETGTGDAAGDAGPGAADVTREDAATGLDAGPDGGPATDLVPRPAPARTPVLVGYGPRAGAPATRRRRAAVVPEPAPRPVPRLVQPDPGAPGPARRALAKPPVRKLARDLGVDLQVVVPTGPRGVVTRADVEQARPAPGAGRVERDGDTRIPVRGVRKATAAAMVASAFTAPHVTEWVQVDVSRTVRFVDRVRADRAFDGVRVSPLLLVARALLIAVRRHPEINASWDGDAGEIVLKGHVNLGIAAATPRGLLVPNVKDADRLSLRELAGALAALTATAREGRTPPSDLTGGTITVTNIGVFGVDGGTPILNPGEAAILAVGAIRRMPWVHKGKVRPRWVTTLSLSFDHRLVDGALGSAVLGDVAAVLERPEQALVLT